MNVLIISKDPTILESSRNTFGDTRDRHIKYAEELKRRSPHSEIRIITYSKYYDNHKVDQVCDGLLVFPTKSRIRALFIIDMIVLFFKVTKNWKPDLITVQTPYEEGFAGLLLARLCKAKFLPQLHFDILSKNWLQEHPLNIWRKFVSLWVMKKADAVRVVSDKLAVSLNKKTAIPRDKIFTLPVCVNFVPVITQDKNRYKRSIDSKLENQKVVLFVGRFYAPKNLERWVGIAEKLLRKGVNANFVMAGGGVDFENVKKIVKDKNLDSHFTLMGNVGHQVLPEVYAAADVFLLTSHYEGFGRVVVESYLAKVPVVSTMSTGPEDIIVDGKTGYLFDHGDDKIVDGLEKLLTDDVLRIEMGEKGYAHVNKSYSLKVLVSKLVDSWISICY